MVFGFWVLFFLVLVLGPWFFALGTEQAAISETELSRPPSSLHVLFTKAGMLDGTPAGSSGPEQGFQPAPRIPPRIFKFRRSCSQLENGSKNREFWCTDSRNRSSGQRADVYEPATPSTTDPQPPRLWSRVPPAPRGPRGVLSPTRQCPRASCDPVPPVARILPACSRTRRYGP